MFADITVVMTEIFTEKFDLLGVNAIFHLIRLVVLLVVLYMQWQQWREGRRPDYLAALVAFLSLVFAELFIAYFYTSGVLQHINRPISQHPFWGDFLQSLSLVLLALITPYLVLRTAGKPRWSSLKLLIALLALPVFLLLPVLEFVTPISEGIPHYPNAVLSFYASVFLGWAFHTVFRLRKGYCARILLSLIFLILSQMFHLAAFLGLVLSWFPMHLGERIFSTLGYIIYLAFMHDHILAEKRVLVDDLRDANAELQRLDRLKNRFLSLASHELRTPLSAIHTAATLLSRKNLSQSEQKSLAEVIGRRSKNLALLVEELLDVARIQLGVLDYHMQPFAIKELLQETVREMRPLADEKNISIELNYQDAASVIHGDEDRLRQVLYNLLANSLRFTASGGNVAIQGYQEECIFHLIVRDTGCGISPQRLPSIFDLYYHNDSDNTSNNVGLGLFIARAIVGAHKGTIEVTSAVGQGTVFTISLPCCDPESTYSQRIIHTLSDLTERDSN